uniref:Uncharacterized protein n=1 Tax=Megaselia scalaris TaxID=36166 RepID=T1H5H0_MEGSC
MLLKAVWIYSASQGVLNVD